MAAPSARFVINFDADTSGIEKSKASLSSLKDAITRDTAALKEMADAMTRLKGTAEVARWEALPKDIRSAESEVSKLSAKMAKLKEDFAKAPAGKQEGLFAAGLQTQGDLDKATKRLSGLKAEQTKLAGTQPVKLFEDLKAGADKLKGTLGKNQTEFSRLGGTMTEAKGKLDAFGEGANAAGSPLGGMVEKFKAFKALGPAATYVAIAVALVVVATGFALVIGKATAFAITMADAYRSAALMREAAAGSAEGGKKLEAITLRIEDRTNAQRDAVAGLASEYARLNLSMVAIEGATSAVTVATSAMGSAAGNTIKGLIDRGVDTKRFWLGAFDLKGTGLARGDVAKQLAKQMGIAVGAAAGALQNGTVKLEDGIKAMDAAVEARFGEIARKQMLALPIQLDRVKKNLAALFTGVKVDGFLEKMDSALGLFKETSVVGDALKTALGTIFQPLVDSAGDSMPLVQGFILGVVIALQNVVMTGLKVAIVLKKAFGESEFLKNIDLVKVGIYGGIAAFALFGTVMTALAVTLAVVAVSMLIASIPLIVMTAAVVGLAVLIWKLIDSLSDLADYMSDTKTTFTDAAAGVAGAIIDGLVEGLKDGATALYKAFTDLAKGGYQAFKDAIWSKSPSRLFRLAGHTIPQGVALGVEDETPKVTEALGAMASPADMGSGSGSAPAGIMQRIQAAGISLVVNYYGNGSREDAQAFAGFLVDELETAKLARA